jgi:hypothetical protein
MPQNTTSINSSESRFNPYTNNYEPMIKTFRSFAVLTSLISMTVLIRLRKKNIIYKYLGVISASDFAYSSLMLFYSSLSYFCYHGYCAKELYYLYMLFYILISEYVTSCLAFYNIILETHLSFQLMYSVLNGNYRSAKSKTSNFIILLLFFISCMLYFPVLFTHRIVEKENNTVYFSVEKTSFGETQYSKLVLTVLTFIRIISVTVVLLVINILTLIRFRRYLRRKSDLKSFKTSKKILFFLLGSKS